MMSADKPVAVTLTVGQWNQVLEHLSRGRFRQVAPLIAEIMRQALPPAAGEGSNVSDR